MLEKIVTNLKKAGLVLLTVGLAYSAPLNLYPKVRIELFNGKKYEGKADIGYTWTKWNNIDKIIIKHYTGINADYEFYDLDIQDISKIEFSRSEKDYYCSEQHPDPSYAWYGAYYDLYYTFTLKDGTRITTDYFGFRKDDNNCTRFTRGLEFKTETISKESALLKGKEKASIISNWILKECYSNKSAPSHSIEKDECAKSIFEEYKYNEGFLVKRIEFINQPK